MGLGRAKISLYVIFLRFAYIFRPLGKSSGFPPKYRAPPWGARFGHPNMEPGGSIFEGGLIICHSETAQQIVHPYGHL